MRRFVFLLLAAFLSLAPLTGNAQTALTDSPNDPRLKQQWASAKINVACAWTHTSGSPDVTVAVIDSGVDMTHPDLVDALRDDGFNFVDNNDDPTDKNGHGTHVAGIIAATINNAEGVAGIAGGGTKILPIRVMDAAGSGTNQDIVAGIRYATKKQVQIINMSLGSAVPLESEDIVAAIQDAHEAGVLVIIAAGNSFVPLPNFAFGIEETALVVAATDEEDRKTDFSNYGKWIAVSAPGDGILSTMPTYDVFLTEELPPEERFKQNYDTMSGTSQATPIVAGVAALVFAEHPDWTAQQVRAEIQKTAVDVSAQNPSKKLGPITYFEASNLGTGRIDACEALGGPIVVPGSPVSEPATSGGTATLPLVAGIGVATLGLATIGIVLLRRRRKPLAVAGGYPPQGPPIYPQGPPVYPQQPQPAPPNQWSPPANRQGATPPLPAVQHQPPPAGLRFDQPPQIADSPAPASGRAWGKLTVEAGPEAGHFFLLREAQITLGRDPGATIPLPGDPTISRAHARITYSATGAYVADLDSSHGTKVNGAHLAGNQLLRVGDRIQVGQTTLRFEA